MKLKNNPAKDLFLLFMTVAAIWTAAWINISAKSKVREIDGSALVQQIESTADYRPEKSELIAAKCE